MFTTLALSTLMLAYPLPRDRESADKGPGYLGITFQGTDDGAIHVTEVRTDGPAIGAGLKVDDVIHKFNGEKIAFDTFARKIIRIRPGTIVPLDVQRGAERLVIKVRIGVRPEDFPYPLPDPQEQPNDPQLNLPPPLPDK